MRTIAIIRRLCLAGLLVGLLPEAAQANPAPFDLTGPALRVAVTHKGATLPISRVPNLSAGDRLSIRADLPADQGARYLLVAAFLRGATNPPPKSWFFQAETWQRKKNMLEITVPEGAGQLVVFLAPETGGGFDAIVEAVRKQPGAFVRASQDLNQASLDRARLDVFLDSIARQERTDPSRIETVSPLLTRSLAIKLKAECLNQAANQQAACLTQTSDSLVLADSHSSSLTETLIGAPTDLAFQVAATPEGGYGYYSPYIGVVRDLARIFGAFQTTQFRYVPSLARSEEDRIALLLNAAPSFAKPKSVIVTALPAIEAPEPPPLRRADADRPLCAARPGLVLPVEGAPLIYATDYAHDMALRVVTPDGGTVDLPVVADPEKGGYVLAEGVASGNPGGTDATLHGVWGFTRFEGPRFRLQAPRTGGWRVADDGGGTLVVGRDNRLVLQGAAAACVDRVEMLSGAGPAQPVAWQPAGGDRMEVMLKLAEAQPGPMTVQIRQHGIDAPERIALSALSETGRMDGFTLHAGDAAGVLVGTRLDMVASLMIDQTSFAPGKLSRANKADSLELAVAAGKPPALTAGQQVKASVRLTDGRTLPLTFVVAPPRPASALISKSIERTPETSGLAIMFAGDRAIPPDARLTFSMRGQGATRFTGRETIEVALADGRASATVDARNGLTIQNDRIAVATVEPARALGGSAYGPLRYRIVQGGVASDWTALPGLVRIPKLSGLTCTAGQEACTLTGSNLFLLDAVAGNAGFAGAVEVPEGFTAGALTIPKPTGDIVFLRLRDDRTLVATVKLPQR